MKLYNEINRENLHTLVYHFYERALKDAQIGAIFALEFGDDMGENEWQEHIALLVNFWDSIFNNPKAYNGDPYGPHFTIVNLKKEYFPIWVALFAQTASEIYTPTIAKRFEEKAKAFSKEFIHRLGNDTSTQPLTYM